MNRKFQRISISQEAIDAYYDAMRFLWHPVARSSQVTDQPLGIQLLEIRLVLARLEGKVVAMEDHCRHLGASLSMGRIENGCRLRCMYHGWLFDNSGNCVDIPNREGAPIPKDAKQHTASVQERYGMIWVCLEEKPKYNIPEFPEMDDPAFSPGSIKEYTWKASAPRSVMAALDESHFPWVHEGYLADPETFELPDRSVTQEGLATVSRFGYAETANPGNCPTESMLQGIKTVNVTYEKYGTPNTFRLVKVSPKGTLTIWFGICPVSFDESISYWRITHDYTMTPEEHDELEKFDETVRFQDKPIVEAQRPWLLPPLSSRLSLYVRPNDAPLIAYQRFLEELGIPQI